MLDIPLPFEKKHRFVLYPVFLPFAGCAVRCSFCNQQAQTGVQQQLLYEQLAETLYQYLQCQYEQEKHVAVAFFGGTFTALPKRIQSLFLSITDAFYTKGVVRHVRCSTRPDYISHEILRHLQQHTMHCIELGVQTFYTPSLRAVKRYYGVETILHAASLVQEYNLELGIQCIVGMPKTTVYTARQDLQYIRQLSPEYVRFYPCLVLEGTELEQDWRKGNFVPWSLQETFDLLIEAQLLAWECAIQVLRIGVAPEQSLHDARLAGVWQDNLGMRVQAHALARYVAERLPENRGIQLSAPSFCKGFLLGDKRELLDFYRTLGFSSIVFRMDDLPYITV